MEYISAGDIEKYSYCPLSWWLSRKEGHRESEGVIKHRNIGKKAKEGMENYRKSKDFERGVMYFAVGAVLVALVGVTMLYESKVWATVFHALAILWLIISVYFLWRYDRLEEQWKGTFTRIMVMAALLSTVFSIFAVSFFMNPNYLLGYILEIASLLWLIGATYFLYESMRKGLHYSQIRQELHLPDGEIIYVDDLKKAPLLKSKKYGIVGRPDMLLKVGKEYVPVEIKTGRVPRGPLFSHIMQLTAYMLLVEENFSIPLYGLLMYGSTVYRIEYEEDLKNILLQKVEEMRKAMRTGEVHRNHNRPGKCRHCSRREICPERLA
ncbi:MAG: CRISPR-associated protein Cas4 [Euryarchaeota archaeon]|nr:CRISPR-associated protein Cas4 [Euryarchaeota archaeon]